MDKNLSTIIKKRTMKVSKSRHDLSPSVDLVPAKIRSRSLNLPIVRDVSEEIILSDDDHVSSKDYGDIGHGDEESNEVPTFNQPRSLDLPTNPTTTATTTMTNGGGVNDKSPMRLRFANATTPASPSGTSRSPRKTVATAAAALLSPK